MIREAGVSLLLGLLAVPINGQEELAAVVARLGSDDIRLRPTGSWTSPDGSEYPAGWMLEVPAAELTLRVTPRLADQEVRGPEGSGVNYWEGLCRFEGTRAGQPVSGQGYVELVGYDGPFSVRF